MMNVKNAVQVAKDWVLDLLKSDGVTDLALEEIDFLESRHLWAITVGFSRLMTKDVDPEYALRLKSPREYKIIYIDDLTGNVKSMKNWSEHSNA